MPEVILPCPACGSNDSECIFGEDEMYSVDCGNCAMRGPAERNPDAAIAAYNTIPRSLTWTHEPPKVAGLYMLRAVLTALGDGQYGPIQLLNITQDMLVYSHRKDFQWAGPIPPPIEP